MPPITLVLSPVERKRLEMLEEQIQGGIEPLREAMNLLLRLKDRLEMALPALIALNTVRTERLWREYGSFLNYLRYWKLDGVVSMSTIARQRLFQYIRTVDALCLTDEDKIPNQSQARELESLPVEQARDVWREVSRQPGAPSAKKVREGARRHTAQYIESLPPGEQKERVQRQAQKAFADMDYRELQDQVAVLLTQAATIQRRCTHSLLRGIVDTIMAQAQAARDVAAAHAH